MAWTNPRLQAIAMAVTNGPRPNMARMMTASFRVRMRFVLRIGSSTLASSAAVASRKIAHQGMATTRAGTRGAEWRSGPKTTMMPLQHHEGDVEPQPDGLAEYPAVPAGCSLGASSLSQQDRPSCTRKALALVLGPFGPETRFYLSVYRPCARRALSRDLELPGVWTYANAARMLHGIMTKMKRCDDRAELARGDAASASPWTLGGWVGTGGIGGRSGAPRSTGSLARRCAPRSRASISSW